MPETEPSDTRTFDVRVPDRGYWKEQICCQYACPVGTDARGYVRAIAAGGADAFYRGEIAAAVGHEVNNPLTAVLGFTDLLIDNPEIPENAKTDLRVVLQEAQRMVDRAVRREELGRFVDAHRVTSRIAARRSAAGLSSGAAPRARSARSASGTPP